MSESSKTETTLVQGTLDEAVRKLNRPRGQEVVIKWAPPNDPLKEEPQEAIIGSQPYRSNKR